MISKTSSAPAKRDRFRSSNCEQSAASIPSRTGVTSFVGPASSFSLRTLTARLETAPKAMDQAAAMKTGQTDDVHSSESSHSTEHAANGEGGMKHSPSLANLGKKGLRITFQVTRRSSHELSTTGPLQRQIYAVGTGWRPVRYCCDWLAHTYSVAWRYQLAAA